MRGSKLLFVVSAFVVLGLVLSACAAPAAAPTPTTPAKPAVTTPAAVATPAAATPTRPAAATPAAAADKIGTIVLGPNEPIHIAYAMVVSGDDATLGLDTKYGAELAIDDAGGKVLDRPVKFDGQDEQCNAEGGQAASSKIAADKTVVAVIGTNCSSAARAAIPILLTQAGLSMISPSNTAEDLTAPGKRVPGYFRTAHNDKVQGAVAAEFVAKQLKFTKAATIHDGSIYAQGLAEVFADTFKKLGGTITGQEAVAPTDKDMKPVLTRIATGQPQLIYYPIFVAAGGAIAAQIRDVPGLEKTAMMGADGVFSPDFIKAGGKNVTGMFWSSPNFEAFGGDYQKLVEKYLKKYNVKTVQAPFHAHAYDAMNIVLAALQKPGVATKSADGTLTIGKQALRDAIGATKDFKGVTGNLTCDQYGDCADPKIGIYQATATEVAEGKTPTKPVWAPGGPNYKP